MNAAPRTYRCRDCGQVTSPAKPTNRCPACGSIYLLRDDQPARRRPGRIRIDMSERFLCLILGALFGLLTFFIWGVALLVNGGPAAAKAAAGAMAFGFKISLALSLLVGIAGFLWGQDKLARLLGVLWGTDNAVNEQVDRLEDRLRSVVVDVPNWLAFILLAIVILGGWGYLATRL